MMLNRIVLLTALFILLNNIGFSQNYTIEYFVGEWDFKGWLSSNKTDKPDFEARWSVVKALDSANVYRGVVQLQGQTYTNELFGFNPVDKEYTRTIYTNDGYFFQLKSKGFAGNIMIWTGIQYGPDGKITRLKEIISVKNEKEFSAVFYKKVGKKWQEIQTEKLTRLK